MEYENQRGEKQLAAIPVPIGKPYYLDGEQLNIFDEVYQVIEKRRDDEPYCLREYCYPGNPTFSDCKKEFSNLKSAINYGNTYGIKVRLHPGDRTSKR
jgi:hypothetical protein